jgi:hypothetical protein
MSIDTQIKLYFKTQAQSFMETYPPLVKEGDIIFKHYRQVGRGT